MTAPFTHPNQSNHSTEHKRSDIRSYYQSLNPNKSTIIRINTQSIESSTSSPKPIFHLNKTKTFIKTLNLENNLTFNGFNSSNTNSSSDSIFVYRLSPDKSKPNGLLLKRSVPSSQSTQSSDTNPIKKRYLVSQRSGKIYEIVDKKQPINGLSVKREASEPDTDLICEDEYFKYLNLIPSKKLKTEINSSLNQWPLRNISKVVSNPKYDHYRRIILTDVCPKPMSSQVDINSNTSEDISDSDISRRKLAKSQWLTEVKDSTNRLFDRRDDSLRDEMTRKRDKEMKEWQTNALNTISLFSLSSFMGKRLFVTLFHPLNQLEKYLKICEIEKLCQDSDVVKYMSTMDFTSNGVTRMSRTRDGSDWNRNYQHKYCFTRIQRLEKWKQLETGLNWRSRLLKSHCRRVYVRVNRLNKCPICGKPFEFDRHQCYEFEPHLRPNKISFQSNSWDSSEEVVIIGDDFNEMSENMTNDGKDIHNNCSQMEVSEQKQVIELKEEIKPFEANKTVEVFKPNQLIKDNEDEEDDDIMIIEEVFKTKDSDVVIKSLLRSSVQSISLKSESTLHSSQSSE